MHHSVTLGHAFTAPSHPPKTHVQPENDQLTERELSLVAEVNRLQAQLCKQTLHPQPPPLCTPATEDRSIQNLADTIASAIRHTAPVTNHPTTSSTQMEKFIARQSTERSLPAFNGAPDEWPVFFNLYKSTTEACGFTAAENLGRLQRSLKGKARDLVHSLLSLPTNVPTIMRTLEMRYGRPDIIIRNLIGKVQALPPVDDSNLIDFAVAVQNLVTTIQAVHAPGHLFNPQLRADLVARLPSSLRLQWGEKVAQIGPNRVTVADLSTWLSAKAEALSYVAIDSMPSSEPTKTAFRPPTGEALLTAPPPPRARGSSQSRSQASTTPTKKCTYCARPHWSDECRTYASLADRRKRLQTLGKCTICLRHNHSSTECRSTRRCYYCQGDHGKHHSSLCPRQRQSTHGTTSPPKRTPETTAVAPAASAAVQPAEPATLVFCKTRLAPTKKVTIPRLELMATVLGIRCLRFVRAQLHLPLQTQDTLWTDSQCVHGWLRSPQPKAPVFVANRLRTIRTHPATVRYVASSDNPADLPSRGVPTILKTQKIWFSGPAWLSLPPTEWPTWNITPQPLQDVLPVSTTPSVMFETKLLALDRRAPNPVLTHLRQRVSTLQQLLRVTAWISRFISNSQKRHCRQQGHLSATEIASARFFWEKAIQQHHYADVLERLHAKQQHPLIRQLDLFLSADGLLRCGGRLQHAAVPASATHPVLLPQDDPYTTLVITDLHQKLQHVGTTHTLSQLRRNYWVPHGRQTVKKTLKECRTCRRDQGQHYNMPPMPGLPSERVNRSPPFT